MLIGLKSPDKVTSKLTYREQSVQVSGHSIREISNAACKTTNEEGQEVIHTMAAQERH